jgi:hypothetical protein
MGILVEAACGGSNVFTGDPNQTTIGIHGTRAATIGPTSGGTFGTDLLDVGFSFFDDLNTLIAYLPAGGKPGSFKTPPVSTDTHYSDSPSQRSHRPN